MNELQKNGLISAGIDLEDAMERFMDNEAMMTKFLIRFLDDPSFSQLCRAMEQQDAESAFEAAHTLKGVAGNLSMKALFQQTSALVEDLRQKDLAAAAGKMAALEEQYETVRTALSALA